MEQLLEIFDLLRVFDDHILLVENDFVLVVIGFLHQRHDLLGRLSATESAQFLKRRPSTWRLQIIHVPSLNISN